MTARMHKCFPTKTHPQETVGVVIMSCIIRQQYWLNSSLTRKEVCLHGEAKGEMGEEGTYVITLSIQTALI
jgi:hypothetical protein